MVIAPSDNSKKYCGLIQKEVWELKIKLVRQVPEPSGVYERINALEEDVVFVKRTAKVIC